VIEHEGRHACLFGAFQRTRARTVTDKQHGIDIKRAGAAEIKKALRVGAAAGSKNGDA
jgi:hypothetical protein